MASVGLRVVGGVGLSHRVCGAAREEHGVVVPAGASAGDGPRGAAVGVEAVGLDANVGCVWGGETDVVPLGCRGRVILGVVIAWLWVPAPLASRSRRRIGFAGSTDRWRSPERRIVLLADAGLSAPANRMMLRSIPVSLCETGI